MTATFKIQDSGRRPFYIWYSEEGTGRGHSPPRHLLAVPHVTTHPSTASVGYQLHIVRCGTISGLPLVVTVPLNPLESLTSLSLFSSIGNKTEREKRLKG